MPTIEKRTDSQGRTSYRAKVRLRGQPVQSATFRRLTDAKRWAEDTASAIREGRYFKIAEAKRHTLADTIARYRREVLPAKSAGTVVKQGSQFDWWYAHAGDYTLADLTGPAIAELARELATEPLPSRRKHHKRYKTPETTRYRSPPTVNRYLAALSHVLSKAVKWGWLEQSPMASVDRGRENPGRVRFLSDDERDALLKACKASSNPDLYGAVVLSLATGARKMEVMGLRWPQVDLMRGHIAFLETKNGSKRGVTVSGAALAILKERAKVRRIDNDLVFPSSKKPKPGETWKPVDLRAPWLTALKTAGIENFRWHDLRHTTASYLAMNGASLAEIAEVLGHKTLAMAQRYSHLSDGHVAGVLERLDQRLFGQELSS